MILKYSQLIFYLQHANSIFWIIVRVQKKTDTIPIQKIIPTECVLLELFKF